MSEQNRESLSKKLVQSQQNYNSEKVRDANSVEAQNEATIEHPSSPYQLSLLLGQQHNSRIALTPTNILTLQRTIGNRSVTRMITQKKQSQSTMPSPPIIQRMKIYPPGVLGTPGIEVENKTTFKKYIRDLEKSQDGQLLIKKYLERIENWLKTIGDGEIVDQQKIGENLVKEIENARWAVVWIKQRPAANDINEEKAIVNENSLPLTDSDTTFDEDAESSKPEAVPAAKSSQTTKVQAEDGWGVVTNNRGKSKQERDANKEARKETAYNKAIELLANFTTISRRKDSTLCVFLDANGNLISRGESGWDKAKYGKKLIGTYLDTFAVKEKNQKNGYGGIQCAEPHAILEAVGNSKLDKVAFSLCYDQKSGDYKCACGSCKKTLGKYSIVDLYE